MIITAITTFILFLSLSASAQNCTTIVSNTVYQTNYNSIASTSGDQIKLDYSKNFIQHSCLSSQQVKQIADLFQTDAYRLEFCKEAFSHTYDLVNFYDVYDAFGSFSNAIRLYDYVNGKSLNGVALAHEINTDNNQWNEPVVDDGFVQEQNTFSFPEYNYPNSKKYFGKVGCEYPMAENDFQHIILSLYNHASDEDKMLEAQNIADNNCLDISHLMKIVSVLQMGKENS